MKVALVHDHLTQSGGAERVLEALQALWPDAPTFTLLYNEKATEGVFSHRDIRPSFLQKMPLSLQKPRWYLPLMPTATESYPLKEFDVVISSSSAFSKGIVTGSDSIHLCYCHTPTRYLWSDTHSYVRDLKASKLVKAALPPLLSGLRTWDRLAADRVDHFIANSETVARRIQKYYQKESSVIYPPVDIHEFSISNRPKTSFLIGGRLVSYKRYDLVIEAFNKLGLPLKVFGSGPMEAELQKMAKSNITFLGRVSNEERARLFQEAIAFLHPQEEDFGITPVESMAAGRPVIAYRKGGATETVLDDETGIFFDVQTWADVADAVIHTQSMQFDPAKIREHAMQFSREVFHKEIKELVESSWKKHERRVLGIV